MERTGYSFADYAIDPQQVRISRSERGNLVLHWRGVEYTDLDVRRAYPLEAADRFIVFFQADGPELGLLKKMADLDADSRQVLADELDKIYFRPVITRVDQIGEEFGVVEADVQTTSGPRHIEIRQIRSKIRLLSKNRALIEDADGNRYELRDWHRMPKMTREILGL